MKREVNLCHQTQRDAEPLRFAFCQTDGIDPGSVERAPNPPPPTTSSTSTARPPMGRGSKLNGVQGPNGTATTGSGGPSITSTMVRFGCSARLWLAVKKASEPPVGRILLFCRTFSPFRFKRFEWRPCFQVVACGLHLADVVYPSRVAV